MIILREVTIDQDIYLTHGNDIIDGAGGSDTVHIDELFSGVSISRDGEKYYCYQW